MQLQNVEFSYNQIHVLLESLTGQGM